MDARIHQYRIARWLRRLFVMLTLVTSCGAQAAGSVPVQWQWWPAMAPFIPYSTLEAAAQASAASWDAAIPPGIRQYITYTGCVENDATGYGTCIETAYIYICLAYNTNSPYNCVQYGDYAYVGPTVIPWGATSACPDNSSFNGTDCTCNVDFVPDPTKTSCVPVAKCSIDDLPPITDPVVKAFEDNPDLSDTAHLKPKMQDALKCLTDHATALGCTPAPSVGSAYRPPAYNQHLIEIWDKWDEIKDSEEAACSNLKNKIEQHFNKHKLRHPPARNSRHTQGLAVDVTINLPAANIDALAKGCNLFRPLPLTDAVHFQFP